MYRSVIQRDVCKKIDVRCALRDVIDFVGIEVNVFRLIGFNHISGKREKITVLS